jgi:small-conductance mechanosensitive channel
MRTVKISIVALALSALTWPSLLPAQVAETQDGNKTAEDTRRVDMVFGISYADDIDRAERVLAEIVEAHDLILEDPQPMVRLNNLGDSSVDFIVRPWTKTEDYWTVFWDVTRAVKKQFDEEGISIPFPLIWTSPAVTTRRINPKSHE